MLIRRWFGLFSFCKHVVPQSKQRKTWSFLKYVKVTPWSFTLKRLIHDDLGGLFKNESVQRYLHHLMEEFREVSHKLQNGYLNEVDRKALMKRHNELLPMADVSRSLEQAAKDHEEMISLKLSLSKTKDGDLQLIQLMRDEEEEMALRIAALRRDLIKTLLPSDPFDSSDVVLEVISGRTTGGDICQQFTKEMFDMYQGFAQYNYWEFEVLNYTPAEYGGLHHAAVRIAGENVYKQLKYEGGTHRVHRIPEVGLSSRMQRIHTGTMTVVILPQPVQLDVHINPKDLRIDTFRSKGAGGQSVNTTDSAVRIVHLPTGVTAECQQTRSQLQNKETAMRVLKARLYQSMMGTETQQRQTARKQQVGTRAQSERIRTYNFSQDRVTDHRTGYTTRDIKEFMRGGEALKEMVQDVAEHADREVLMELVETGRTTD